jgi:hypothetical protein
LIGGACKHSNVFSVSVLIARGLDLNTGYHVAMEF